MQWHRQIGVFVRVMPTAVTNRPSYKVTCNSRNLPLARIAASGQVSMGAVRLSFLWSFRNPCWWQLCQHSGHSANTTRHVQTSLPEGGKVQGEVREMFLRTSLQVHWPYRTGREMETSQNQEIKPWLSGSWVMLLTPLWHDLFWSGNYLPVLDHSGCYDKISSTG